MKKIITLLLLLSLMLPALVACSEGSDVPEGMQLCRGSDSLGYYFYVPEEWLVSNVADISSAYASRVDTSSASYVEVKAPSESDESLPVAERRLIASKEYFSNSMANFKVPPVMVNDGEAVTFGNPDGPAENAIKFVYDHEYQGHKFRTMQILVYFQDRFGIFTFNSANEAMSSDIPQFEYYSEKVQQMIDSFRFVSRSESALPEDNRTADADGYLLSSDKNTAGFALYLPAEFRLHYSEGMVTASLADGSSFTAARLSAGNGTIGNYWLNRKQELSDLFGDITVIAKDLPYELPSARSAFYYEYTFMFAGEEYHVYQVLATSYFSGFSFTYTAKAQNYDMHIELIKKILGKVEL